MKEWTRPDLWLKNGCCHLEKIPWDAWKILKGFSASFDLQDFLDPSIYDLQDFPHLWNSFNT
jgi:hypothetical protein